jgi:DNA-binding transcriptional LysR family regulator
MADIDVNKIRQLDGSLLLVLRELLRHRRTTTVAQRLGLSQPAVSHALSRLRELFGDALFIRRPHGLEPTRHALALAPRVDILLASMNEAMTLGSQFVAATSERDFRIGAPDHLTTLLAPPLLRAFASHARNARFAFSQRLGQDALDALKRDELDLALGRFGRTDGFTVEPVFEDRYCVVARRDHPKLKRRLTPERYAALDHIQISIGGDFRCLEIEPIEAIDGGMATRKPVAAVPRFLIAFAVIAQSDVVALAPRRLAQAHAQRFGLRLVSPPLEIAPIRVLAVRKPEADPAITWLLAQIKAAVQVAR